MAIATTFLAIIISTAFLIGVAAWTVPLKNDRHRRRRHPWLLSSHGDRYPGGEVIGSSGKIGSYILHRLNARIPPKASRDGATDRQYPQSLHAAPVPRGVSPGCLSPNDTPIYACIPSSSIVDVWEATLPSRRRDLVFLCNLIPSRHLAFDSDVDVTVAILHFGVSHANTDENCSGEVPLPQLNRSPQAPPTVVYGKHARGLACLLEKDGVSVDVVSDPKEIQAAAARKLAWSSLMWLLCHQNEPVRVKDVHRFKSNDLRRLVEEIAPLLAILTTESWTSSKSNHGVDQPCDEIIPHSDRDTSSTNPHSTIGLVEDILDYLECYSRSISDGNVIPSRELAMCEIKERNGVLLSLMDPLPPKTGTDEPRNYHVDLIRQVAGDEILRPCLEAGTGAHKRSVNESVESIPCISSSLEFLFHANKSSSPPPSGVAPPRKDSKASKSAIVIGAGMLGSSIAYHLSMRGVNVTVLDQRTNLLPPSGSGVSHAIDPGTATSSSFAWLNANNKSPLSYKQFNHLGMEIWRRHDLLKRVPVWCGALVRTAHWERDEGGNGGASAKLKSPYYTCVGPLDWDEACWLEPGVNWSSVSHNATGTPSKGPEVHFYPEEGHVCPSDAVKALRVSAVSNGAEFLEGVQVDRHVRGSNGKVVGVEFTSCHTHGNGNASEQPVLAKADVVVIAAGAESSNPTLGIGPNHLQLVDQPGILSYVQSKDTSDERQQLKRICVDTMAQAHVLRRDNTIVVGGGELVVGGKGDEDLDTSDTRTAFPPSQEATVEDTIVGNAIVETAATAIAPFELQPMPTSFDGSLPGYELVKVIRANRPMPSDGIPVIGFAEQGLYVAVMHSGITLGPLVGELAAYEVWESMTKEIGGGRGMKRSGFYILDQYRPDHLRFNKSQYQ